MSEPIALPPVLDLKAVEALKAALLERRGQPLQIDASGVQRLGGLCLQTLLAARKTWEGDVFPFSIEPRSEAFSETLRLFGAEARFESVAPIGVEA
jgi:chemotaxis protein CheX